MNIDYFDPFKIQYSYDARHFICNWVQKSNIKLNFEKDRLNLQNMRRKINQREKNKIIRILWIIEKIEQFSQY